MVQAIQVLRFHLLELEKVSNNSSSPLLPTLHLDHSGYTSRHLLWPSGHCPLFAVESSNWLVQIDGATNARALNQWTEESARWPVAPASGCVRLGCLTVPGALGTARSGCFPQLSASLSGAFCQFTSINRLSCGCLTCLLELLPISVGVTAMDGMANNSTIVVGRRREAVAALPERESQASQQLISGRARSCEPNSISSDALSRCQSIIMLASLLLQPSFVAHVPHSLTLLDGDGTACAHAAHHS